MSSEKADSPMRMKTRVVDVILLAVLVVLGIVAASLFFLAYLALQPPLP